ncbi:hypothetical protein [Paenibacillus gansuensis]|uniref:DUF3052 domain-containing protein n=1 Tax=Paenibacillus gansuensis TaxID=306542 RepID=A0ABW5PAH5_9BACL
MDNELLKKMKYKGGRAAIMNVPEGIQLGLPAVQELEGAYDFVVGFMQNAQQVKEQVPRLVSHLGDDAVFWICYPKKQGKVKPDINRDSLFTLVGEMTDYRAVSNVAVNELWSALRFRHKDLVKK